MCAPCDVRYGRALRTLRASVPGASCPGRRRPCVGRALSQGAPNVHRNAHGAHRRRIIPAHRPIPPTRAVLLPAPPSSAVSSPAVYPASLP